VSVHALRNRDWWIMDSVRRSTRRPEEVPIHRPRTERRALSPVTLARHLTMKSNHCFGRVNQKNPRRMRSHGA